MASILFVCLGNICRSPAAQGILLHMALKDPVLQDLHVESCGLGEWHIGQLPDPRMREASQNRGIVLTSRAQQFQPAFMDSFDLILAADSQILNELHKHAKTTHQKAKIHLITHFSPCYQGKDIPDPYYQGEAGFEHILDMLEDSCEGLVEHLKSQKK